MSTDRGDDFRSRAGHVSIVVVDADTLLARRHGVFLASEAERFGVRRGRGGHLLAHRMLYGVYGLLPPPWSAEARWTAGVLRGGPRALLYGAAGLAAFGLMPSRAYGTVDVAVSHSSTPSQDGFVRFWRSRNTEPASYGNRLRLVRDLAPDVGVASPRTLAAYLGSVQPNDVRGPLASMVQRKLLTIPEAAAWAAAHPRGPGNLRLGQVAAQLAGGLQSEGEARLHLLARTLGMPADETQVEVWCGPTLVSVTDAMWWVGDGVAGYFDGAVHLDFAAHQQDVAIRDRLRTAGLVVLEATSLTLRSQQVFGRTLRSRLEQARAGVPGRVWWRSRRGIELPPGY